MRPCRECDREVSEQALACPGCGAPHPARERWDGYGFEYRSRLAIAGLPLLHVSFKYRPNRLPVVARGWIAIGQFAVGVVTLSQFGVGIVSVSQFTIAGFAPGPSPGIGRQADAGHLPARRRREEVPVIAELE